LDVCPAVTTDFLVSVEGHDPSLAVRWGSVLEIWEGHATDETMRYEGSSGGALTAIAAYCTERLEMHGTLHISGDDNDPVRNRAQLSRTRQDLMAATGSRYAPAAVCDGLRLVEQAPAPCCIIGKPVEIAAISKARHLNSSLDKNIGLTLSFFCAETPSTQGTTSLLNRMGYAPDTLRSLRYRGFGWPGHFAPVRKGESEPQEQMTYRESWSFLQAFRPWSVQLWPDGSGELADISCGDPWYEEPDGENPGFSLIVVRTVLGQKIIQGAIEAGYLNLQPAKPWKLENSQRGLVRKKGAVWGRLIIMRLMRLPTPRFTNNTLFRCWLELSINEKLRSTLGTLRRIISRRITVRLTRDIDASTPVKPALDLTPANQNTGAARSMDTPI
jgi:coenzyme F420 hydrogenase subunit beta